MNIIIVGCGKVGQKIAEKLCQEDDHHDITIVDVRRSIIQDAVNQFDIMGVVGNGASLDTLNEAGVEDADILIAVTGSDELNLLTCLIAKKAGNCQTIARVRKPEYSKEQELFKEDLGLAMIINPELTAAAEMARLLRFPSAIQIDTFAKGRVEILKFRIPDGNVLNEMKILEIEQKLKCDVLVCGVERGAEAFIPDGNFILQKGDSVSIVASIPAGMQFFKKAGIKTDKVKDAMIVGGGTTAYYLAKMLLKTNIGVKIIEQNEARCEELSLLLPKAMVIHGDGTDNNVLLEEGLAYTDSFVALTNIDEENILLSLYAKSKTNCKRITKINRVVYDEVIDSLDLDTIIYPKNITAEYIVRFVRAKEKSRGSNIETMHLILDDKAEALEYLIGENSPVANIPLESLDLKENVLIACISREGNVIIPRGKDIILPGDNVIVVTTNRGYTDISDIVK